MTFKPAYALRALLCAAVLFVAACDDSGSSRDQEVSSSNGMASKVRMMAAESSSMGGNPGFAGGAAPQAAMMVMPAPAPAMDAALQESMPPSSMVLDRSKFKGRRIAETHSLQIQTMFDALQARYQRDYAKCVEMGCEILNSNVQLEQGGNINARIDPAKLGAFLDFLAAGEGKILNHSVSADDQSMEFSDTQAQLDNLMATRDRMRKLLDSPKADEVEGILAIENELNRIQTEIDMRTSRLRNLTQITDMATLNLNYSVEYRPAEAQPYTLKNTWKNTVQRFYIAVDRMVQWVGGVLPWIPVFAIGAWLGVLILRFAFARISFGWLKRKNKTDVQ